MMKIDSLYVVFLLLTTFTLTSCNESNGTQNEDGDTVTDEDAGSVTDEDTDSVADAEGENDAETLGGGGFVLDGNYDDWENGDDSWAKGDIVVVVDETHPGWNQARCFDCHGVGRPFEVVDHDPRMQYWSWSCARGFPGGECHGHGVNGAGAFNHGGDPFFEGCTREGCHELYNSKLADNENHGFVNAPDSFCNACHDYYWKGWP